MAKTNKSLSDTTKKERLAKMQAATFQSVNDPRPNLTDTDVDAHFIAKRADMRDA